MIVLFKDEQEFLDEIQRQFWDRYQTIITKATEIATMRGANYDITPVHHRMSPEGMVHEITKKGGRLQSITSSKGWYDDPEKIARIVQEAPDIINYAAFLAAFAILKLEEVTQADLSEADYDPEEGSLAEKYVRKYGRIPGASWANETTTQEDIDYVREQMWKGNARIEEDSK